MYSIEQAPKYFRNRSGFYDLILSVLRLILAEDRNYLCVNGYK
jgi:hypothetical protein